MACQLYFKVV